MSIKIVRDDTAGGVRTIVVLKGHEQYIFRFHPFRWRTLVSRLGVYGADPELSLTWHDVGQLSRYISSSSQVKS